MNQPKVLMFILDGWGINKPYPGNAIRLAETPFFDDLWHNQPHAKLDCSGLAVGLPAGQMGTSEVNHMIIGAGKIIYQDLVKINQAIDDESFFTNPEFIKAFEHVKKHDSRLHLKGLYSPGGVHSHSKHFKALLQASKQHGLEDKTFLHLMTDGRDTKPKAALEYITDLENFLETNQIGQIVSISGRYYAMDRDNNWERTDQYFDMITQGKTEHIFKTAAQAIQTNYQQEISDEFIEPALIKPEKKEPILIRENDAVIFLNFRSDRPRQLVARFIEQGPSNLYYLTMTQYNQDFQLPVAFPPEKVEQTLGAAISQANLKQLRITETEKFAHLTFFMNCKREKPYPLEERIMFDSYSDIKNHDERPEMRTPDIASRLKQEIAAENFSAIFTNFCNADMVGHTGNIPATIKGIEAIDQALSTVIPTAQQHGYEIIVTADHGNAEQMLDEEEGDSITAHSNYPVPFILISEKYQQLNQSQAGMVNIAPTILKLLTLKKPDEMTGEPLI